MQQLFHFDLKPRSNYGDSILFELVRLLFDGYSGRHGFLVTSSANLRHRVSPGLVAQINAAHDAVVLGGGGLMLRSTNENRLSGWQWKMPLEQLRALTVPLVVFAVGYNRFEGEPEFDPVFTAHLSETVARSAFFGLRNHGSIERVRHYLPADLHDRLLFQPCPTTVASHLVPDLHVPDLRPERRVGFQVTFEARNELAGYDGDDIFDELLRVARELRRRGFALDVISHHPGDRRFHEFLAAHGVTARLIALDGIERDIHDGLAYYGRLPLTIGMRGHGQMIPFGMGNGIISVAARDKLRWFADDIGHPELAVDPRGQGWSGRVLDLVDDWFGDFAARRDEFAHVRERLWQTCLDNLALISATIDSRPGERGYVPFTPYERELALNTFAASRQCDREAERMVRLRDELRATRARAEAAEARLARLEAQVSRLPFSRTLRRLGQRLA
ncbi:polysaccharide pyruvyl transferase family protein [Propionicimonas sp.]|uniref:polysaccharide pyruvyl transferase family protein n=1 Tax=Propionicimonas sp. TaxID=1955623 RepID=UPI003D0C7155